MFYDLSEPEFFINRWWSIQTEFNITVSINYMLLIYAGNFKTFQLSDSRSP